MSDLDPRLHSRGESRFVADLPEPEGLLRAAVLVSPVAHGRITRLDVSPAADSEGVAAVLIAADIPGENQIGTLMMDEPLLACGNVHYVGQPVAVAYARSERQARAALGKVVLEIEPLPPIIDPREAQARGELIVPPRTFCLGDVESAWAQCDLVVEGRAESGGQEHGGQNDET